MRYQDLELSKTRVARMFLQNPDRSISATFCNLRKKSYNTSIGDYPLLYVIVETILGLSIYPSRSQINYAFNKSEELQYFSKKDKSELLNQLIEPTYIQLKQSKNDPQSTKYRKQTNSSLKKNNN